VYVFINERGTPFDRTGFNWMVKRAGRKAKLPFPVHAHMLRPTPARIPAQSKPI
jgi:integrase